MGFEIGKTVAGYEIVEVLGTSKTGVAYKVRNVFAQRFEVLKILPKSIQDDEEQNARFLREIKVHAQLLHPNIVTFYNAREIEGQLVMTKEFVPGVTVAEKLQAGPIAWHDASRYACQALAALDYAHGHGIIHRGLSSSNLIVTSEGIARLTGFGFAKSVSDPELTAAGVVIGALKYMSPEQVKGEAVDARSDMYSLGIVLYEMLAGKLPFDAKGQFEIMLAHVNTPPKHASDVNPGVPRVLGDLVARALAKAPGDRFQTAREFREAIEAVSVASDTEVAALRPTFDNVAPPDAEAKNLVMDSGPWAKAAAPAPPATLPDAWALESALELAESKLARMELKSAPSATEALALVDTSAPVSRNTFPARWGIDAKPEVTPEPSVLETAGRSEVPSAHSRGPADWWTQDAAVTPAESTTATAVLEHVQSAAEVPVLHEPQAIISAISLPDAPAVETVNVLAESNSTSAELVPHDVSPELPPPVVALEEYLQPVQAAVEVNAAPVEPTANTSSSPVAVIADPPSALTQPVADFTARSEAPEPISLISLPDADPIDSSSVSVESKPVSIESVPEHELTAPVASVAEPPAIPQISLVDWWTRNSNVVSIDSKATEPESAIAPVEPEPATPIVTALEIADSPAADSPNTPINPWAAELPSAPVGPKAESSQLELLRGAWEPSQPLVEATTVPDSPALPVPASQPDLWATESALSSFESNPASAFTPSSFSPETASRHQPEETPLTLWTAGPPETWVSEPEPIPAPTESKSQTADLQSLAAPVEPPQAPVEPTALLETPVVAPVAQPEPQVVEPALAATELAPQPAPSDPAQAAAVAMAGSAAPVAPAPVPVNPDLLTALFGDTLLSRLSLTLVVCAITFFLGTVTLFAVLSVTKP